ncbi:fibronectin type III domain-containing protein [Candidatus Uhrbacteria bacterium]|nr:fibronectin type III domain-containing protein [Candidatus Uhrbacteria bacterium]
MTITMSAVVVFTASAATITGVNDYPTTLQSSQAANHTMVFTTPTGAALGSTITLSFSTPFDTSTITEDDIDVADDGVDLTTAATCAGTEQASVSVASDVVTITICAGNGGAIAAASQVTVEIGTHATASGTGAHRITNPSSTGTYFVTVAGIFGDDGSIALPISGDDSVSVTGTVSTLSGGGTGTGGGGSSSSDSSAPTISAIVVTSVSESSVIVTWTTSESATSAVSYGKTSALELLTSTDSASTTFHAITLTGLTPGETYYFAVSSTDQSGNEATSSTQTFTTLDETAPVISGVEVIDVTTTTARVTWTTDESADSRVSYGETTAYDLTAFDSSLVTSHSITLTDLSPGTTYHFQVFSSDFSENQSYTDDDTFETDTDDAPANVSDLEAQAGDKTITLTWMNPSDEDLAGVRILACTNGYPDSPTDTDCTRLYAGLTQSYTLTGLTNGTTYAIGVFAYDDAGQFASGALVTAVPRASEDEVPSKETTEEEEEPGIELPGNEEQPVLGQETVPHEESSTGEGLTTGAESEEPTSLGAEEGTLSDSDLLYFVEEESLELTTTDAGVVEVLPGSAVLITIPSSDISPDAISVLVTVGPETYLMSLDELTALYEAQVTITDTAGVYTLTVTVTSGDGSSQEVSSYLYVINPGYVYQVIDGEEVSVAHAKVLLYEVVDGERKVWDGSPYHQDNPITTPADGTFAWYVPNGTYVVIVTAQGFETAQTSELGIENGIVNPTILLEASVLQQGEQIAEGAIGSAIQNVLSAPPLEAARAFLETVRDLPGVEATATISTPVLALVSGASLVVLSVSFDFLPFLQYFFTAPVLFFARRRRKGYGVVYNAIGKTPIDLAVVRLFRLADDEEATPSSGRLLQSRVTDRGGRYFFLVSLGRYRLSVTKTGYEFPTAYLKDEKTDGQYLDVYHSEVIEVKTADVVITANIPMDPSQAQRYQAPASVLWRARLGRMQQGVALLGIIASIIFAIIRPTLFSVGMIALQAMLYLLVRRLARPYKPVSWGIVYAQETGRPLSRVVARIFEPKYNKLLETQVTDSKGRYAFLLGPNQYFAVFEKEGFSPKEIRPIDYSGKAEPTNFSQKVALDPKDEDTTT